MAMAMAMTMTIHSHSDSIYALHSYPYPHLKPGLLGLPFHLRRCRGVYCITMYYHMAHHWCSGEMINNTPFYDDCDIILYKQHIAWGG